MKLSLYVHSIDRSKSVCLSDVPEFAQVGGGIDVETEFNMDAVGLYAVDLHTDTHHRGVYSFSLVFSKWFS